MIIHFTGCLQNSQVLGSTNEHTISQLFFIINQQPYDCVVRQPHGSDNSFEDDPLEVEIPANLKGEINYGAFREVAEHYYRSLIGSSGGGIRIGPGSKNITMTNNRMWQTWTVEIPDVEHGGGW